MSPRGYTAANRTFCTPLSSTEIATKTFSTPSIAASSDSAVLATASTPTVMADTSSSEQVDFVERQPSYIRAMLQPSSLEGYRVKYEHLPRFLDYALFGPPVIRDSSPGGMSYIFGRTEHDEQWNKQKKGAIVRSMHVVVLVAAYIFFLAVPAHMIWKLGIAPYYRGT